MVNIMNTYKFKTFTTEQNTYPTTYYSFDLCDCTPNNPDALYTVIDHAKNDDYLDDDEQLEIQIPNRLALYQLIRDINIAINKEIDGYAKLHNPCAPLDDATSDIHNAVDIIKDLISFDEL